MRHLSPIPVVLATAAAVAAQEPGPWIYLDSVETGSPPRLLLELEGGGQRVIPAAADTILIAYLAEHAFAQHQQLSVDADDKNHTLIRFDVPADLKVTAARFVATAHPSQLAPPGDTTFRVHLVEAAWGAATKWSDAPAHGAVELATVRVPFGGGEIAVELTETVRKWQREPARNFGILLRALQADGPPKPAPPRKPGPAAGETPMQQYQRQQALNQRLVHCLPWQTDARAAREVAATEGKLVLAFALADVGPAGNAHERALAVTALLDPELRSLIEARFVPLRLATHSGVHLGMEGAGADPLAALGTDAVTAKAPSLVVCTAGGECVAVLASIGTWSRQLVAGFLLHALAGREHPAAPDVASALRTGDLARARTLAAGLPAVEAQRTALRIAALQGDVPAMREASSQLQQAGALTQVDAMTAAAGVLAMREIDGVAAWLALAKDGDPAHAAWLRGELAWLQGDAATAQQEWLAAAEAAPPESPLRLRAELRLEYALGIDEVGPARPVAYAPTMATTEQRIPEKGREALAHGAVAWLLGRQQRDGRFAHPGMATYDAAVTALCGKALHVWSPGLPDALRARAAAALERVETWCGGCLRGADPKTADSFGAGYLVDFLAARAASSPAAKQLVPAAIELLVAGQLPNGAWSYSRQFGEGWVGGFGGWPKTDQGRAHSINTGIALWALANARAAGFAVPEERVAAGVRALGQMKATAVTFTYTWPEPKSFAARDQSIGKAPVCVQALVALGAAPTADLEQAVADFMQWRAGLRKTVKLTPSWIGPSGTSSYFFLHAYYHAAEAAAAAGGDQCAQRLAALGGDLLACAEADGTWLDFEESGKTYGTAMALLVLARSGR